VDNNYCDLPRIYKLSWFGISGNLFLWLESFVTCRLQCTTVDGTISSSIETLSGVPQGSVLGPLLFLLFVNDLPYYLSSFDHLHSPLKLFADDIKSYAIVNNISQAILFQVFINCIYNWCQS